MTSDAPGREFLRHVFPFYLLVSETLELLAAGPAAERVLPAAVPGALLSRLFVLARPYRQEITPAALRDLHGEVVVLRNTFGVELQGEVIECRSGFLILAVPVVTDLAAISRLGLTLRDFAAHDVTGDFLLLLQSTRTNMQAMERTSLQNIKQHHELERTKAALDVAHAAALESRAALSVSERQYRTLVNAVSEIIFRVDEFGQWAFLNDAWTAITGFTTEEVLGRPVIDFIHPDDRARVAETYVGQTQREFRIEFRLLDKAGTAHWCNASVALLGPEQGQPAEMTGVISDSTLHREALERLEQSGQQMLEAKAVAEAANQAKSDWLAAMSHEIRTPVHVLTGMAEALADTAIDESQQQILVTMLANAAHLRSLVAGLLDLSKIQLGQLDQDIVEFEVRQIILEAAQLARVHIGRAPVVVTSSVDATVPAHLKGDAGRIRQILFNLASNAGKFTPRGDIRLSATGALGEDRTYLLCLTVSDTGVGIPKADQPNIFKNRFRASNATATEGTGLGLHIAAALTEGLGGSIEYSSTENGGTSFQVIIPSGVTHSDPAVRLDSSHGLSERVHLTDHLRPSRVLVVEDFPPSQQLATAILTRAGHWVEIAATGSAAVALATKRRYDVILMDIQLPDFSGIEAAVRIRAAEQQRLEAPVPIVAVTAHALEDYRQRSKEAEINAFMTKPTSAIDLCRAVSDWSDTRRTVLVADDSSDARDLLIRFLGNEDLRIVQARSGVDALVQLNRQDVDLVILDMHMPGLNGLDTAWQIRLNPRLRPVPILALTGEAGAPAHERLLAAGCAAVLVKPVNKASLLRAVHSALGDALPPPNTASRTEIPADLADLIPRYLDGLQRNLVACRPLLARRDFSGIQSIAHNIKGTGTSYGFPDVSRFAREMESAATALNEAHVRATLAMLDTSVRDARAAIGGLSA